MLLDDRIKGFREAIAHAEQARRAAKELGAEVSHADAFIANMRHAEERLEEERDERNKEIYGNNILRVEVVNPDGHAVKSIVQFPDKSSPIPYISEVAYEALVFRLGKELRTAAGFDVAVLGRNGRMIFTIQSNKKK